MKLSVRTWFLLCAIGCFVVSGCGGDDDDGFLGDDDSGAGGGDDDGPVYELNGTYEFGSGFAIRFEGNGARLISFGGGFVTGRQYFDVGDEYIRNIVRIGNSTWKGEIARFDRVAAPSESSSYLHIVGVTYVESMLQQSSLFLTVDVDNGIGTTRLSKGSRTEYEYGGACESGFENTSGDTLYYCTDADDSECNSLPGEAKFWANTTCRQLGYSFEYDSAQFQYDAGNNGIPGPHGQWGDKRGGTGEGWADGSGGKPPADAVAVMSEDTGNAGTGGRGGEGGAGAAGSGGGTDCFSGTWKTPTCGPGSGKFVTLSFDGSGTTGRGRFTNPECHDSCDPIVFEYTYTVSGMMLTLDYDKTADPVACIPLGIDAQPVTPPQAPDVMTYTCTGSELKTQTSLGEATYTRN